MTENYKAQYIMDKLEAGLLTWSDLSEQDKQDVASEWVRKGQELDELNARIGAKLAELTPPSPEETKKGKNYD